MAVNNGKVNVSEDNIDMSNGANNKLHVTDHQQLCNTCHSHSPTVPGQLLLTADYFYHQPFTLSYMNNFRIKIIPSLLALDVN